MADTTGRRCLRRRCESRVLKDILEFGYSPGTATGDTPGATVILVFPGKYTFWGVASAGRPSLEILGGPLQRPIQVREIRFELIWSVEERLADRRIRRTTPTLVPRQRAISLGVEVNHAFLGFHRRQIVSMLEAADNPHFKQPVELFEASRNIRGTRHDTREVKHRQNVDTVLGFGPLCAPHRGEDVVLNNRYDEHLSTRDSEIQIYIRRFSAQPLSELCTLRRSE